MYSAIKKFFIVLAMTAFLYWAGRELSFRARAAQLASAIPFTATQATIGMTPSNNGMQDTTTIAVRSDRSLSMGRTVPGSKGVEVLHHVISPDGRFVTYNVATKAKSGGYLPGKNLDRMLPLARPPENCVGGASPLVDELFLRNERLHNRDVHVVAFTALPTDKTLGRRVTEWRDASLGCFALKRAIDSVALDGSETALTRMFTTSLVVGVEPDPNLFAAPAFREVTLSEQERLWLDYTGTPVTAEYFRRWSRIDSTYQKMQTPQP